MASALAAASPEPAKYTPASTASRGGRSRPGVAPSGGELPRRRLRYSHSVPCGCPPSLRPALVLTAVVFAAGLAAIPQQPAFRSGIEVVNLGVAVIDKGGAAVAGLTQDDFVVFEEGKKQELRYFAADGAKDAQADAPTASGRRCTSAWSSTPAARWPPTWSWRAAPPSSSSTGCRAPRT